MSSAWERDIRTLAGAGDVTCKLSGLVTEASWDDWDAERIRPYADRVLEAFGPDRVMFGSDWPVCLVAADYDDVVGAADALTASLSPAERERVFTRTAVEFYRLA